jgi:hypothetical protein
LNRRLLALLAVTVAGCGGTEPLSAERIRADPAAAAADLYLLAGVTGDLPSACELTTREERIEQGGNGTIATCVQQAQALDPEVRSATQEIFGAAAITRVERIDERTRIVQFAIDPEQVAEFAGQDLEEKLGEFTMVLSGGAWRLDEYKIVAN